jgi:small subunit ribosomal protein S2
LKSFKKDTKTFTINQLLFVQAHLGNKISKWNPLTKSFIFGSRHGVHFFDLKQTTPYLKRVLFLLTKATTNHQIILFIGPHPFVSVLVKFLARNTRQSSISRKWVGGTLTNWLKIRPYVRFLYRTNIAQIRKKFVLKTEKKIEQKIAQYLKMKYLLSGIENMPTLPNLVVIFEKEASISEKFPFLEAHTLMIPIISIVNTGPRSIFGNDYLFDSLFFFGNLMLQAIRCGLIQKRLIFLKFYLKIKKSQGKIRPKALKIRTFFRVYRSYKLLALKRALRYFIYIKKNKCH